MKNEMKGADTSDYESRQSQTNTHTHIYTPTQVRSNSIDYWNNNKASIIDSLVLSAYEIGAKSSNQGHYSVPGRSQQKTEQDSSINHYFLKEGERLKFLQPVATLLVLLRIPRLKMIIKNESLGEGARDKTPARISAAAAVLETRFDLTSTLHQRDPCENASQVIAG